MPATIKNRIKKTFKKTLKNTLKIIVLLSLSFSLAACERIQETFETLMADQNSLALSPPVISVSAAQDQKIQILYRSLQSKQLSLIQPLLDSSLQQQIKQSPELIAHMLQLIPSEKPEHYRVLTTLKSVMPPIGKITTVVALFEYPKDVIALTVVFAGGDGGTTILAVTVDQVNQASSSSSIDQIELDLATLAKKDD